ncbi:MAG: flagellar filament capping protein FliD [Rhodoferax sp.]|nr:flagellar filament capping protein FliD [Rhodoferax sp.]
MNISDIVQANSANKYLGLNSNAQALGSVSAVGQAGLQKAEKRIQAQVDVTTAQLSSFGKLKSSVSGAQFAAHTLGNLTATSTTTAIKTAADSFVSAFNTAVTTAKTTAAVPGETAASQSAGRVAKNLSKTVSENTATIDSLKKIGFNMQPDGTLTLDAKKFADAQKADPVGVKATLAKMGQQVDKTATQELATSSNLSASVSSLNQRATVLKGQQSTLASLQQTPTSTPNSNYAMYGGFGLASYQNY